MREEIERASEALRAAVKAGRVPPGADLEIRPMTDGIMVMVMACDFPVVPRDWQAWADTRPSERGEMPPCLTTRAADMRGAILAELQPLFPDLTVKCDFAGATAKPAGVAAVKL